MNMEVSYRNKNRGYQQLRVGRMRLIFTLPVVACSGLFLTIVLQESNIAYGGV